MRSAGCCSCFSAGKVRRKDVLLMVMYYRWTGATSPTTDHLEPLPLRIIIELCRSPGEHSFGEIMLQVS